MSMLIASVPPLLSPSVSKYASTCARHARSVRPSRATSGIGQDGKLAMTFSASVRLSRRLAVPA
jgi:hypothetical protein